MRKVNTTRWLLTLTAACGLATSASAQENQFVQRADSILGAQQGGLVQQINHECAPLCDADPCDGLGCDSVCEPGCGLGGCFNLFGGLDCFNFCSDSCDASGGCDSCSSCYLWEGCGFDLGTTLCGECSPIDIGGWLQSGYTSRSTGLFNTRPNKWATHQAWLYAEKVADGSNGFDWGFRGDFMYGLDANDTQAFGNEPGNWDYENGFDHGQFGFAIPQLYGEVAFGDWSIKAGHFYTLLGYEVVTAPDNFFFSHAFTMYNSEAFTHTGALATYSASDNVTLYGGWTLGWDTGFNQFDQFGKKGNSFLGGYSFGIGDNISFTHIITAGDFGWIGDGYSQSIVVDVALSDKLNWVIQSDLLNSDNRVTDANDNLIGFEDGNETIGLNQYLLYSVNECFGVGGRAEWWKSNGASVYALTGGVNYRPTPNLVVRPELRYQWDPGNDNAGIENAGKGIFGVDAILTF
ncbi:hypothetical protein KOR42_08370 [Thalassoglobus neptunius]|uniref:Porin n=1 Tax=Thalassoglobus neptunius TaxID=1938619 RepID=A0A5C5X3E4_9PLAN|nr:outer membrane beta-barrel protein [Thalassoglobus neptunius]TWT57476.1 hypothetical protein KOR42_08370 [Thalassoglobus neptunius]